MRAGGAHGEGGVARLSHGGNGGCATSGVSALFELEGAWFELVITRRVVFRFELNLP